ncbi:hypothetical protein OEZ49_22500 [Ruegeria sp. WL0004]|uniref:Uncharacterized protein n=1 Tax=Ruegeria marisflavi TaxID=2984152 RepID=A0ABT2X376_9RHOB|nr:hypothetical protein [Ruegeria sp. WL0004]MCU9840523.1 hypothetical protein [Ruegeria sp. WL0004]
MTASFTRKIGSNRGKPRLWIEGAHLTAAGLLHGTRWTLTKTDSGLTIAADPEGKRRIAGKPGRPIIDINSAAMLGPLADAETVVVAYEPGSGRLDVRRG